MPPATGTRRREALCAVRRNLRPSGRGGCQHHFPIGDAEKIGTGEDSRPDRRRRAGNGSVRAMSAALVWISDGQRSPARKQSMVDGNVPAWQKEDAVFHAAEPRPAPAAGRGSDLGNGFSVPGDDHFFAGLHGPDDLRRPVLGFGNADVHVLDHSYFLSLSRPVPARHPGLRHYAQRE